MRIDRLTAGNPFRQLVLVLVGINLTGFNWFRIGPFQLVLIMGRQYNVTAYRFSSPNSSHPFKFANFLMSDFDLLSRILDSLPVFIGLVDANQRYEYVNATYVARYNLPKDKIIGMTVRQLNGDDEYKKSRAKIDAVLSGENIEFEYQAAENWFRINYLPRWSGNKVTGYFVISTDITQLKKTTTKLENSIRELRTTQSSFENFASFAYADRLASVGAMAVGLAHDISQPISSLNILVDSLSATIKDSALATKLNPVIANIQQQVQFAADITNRLRRFSSDQKSERTENDLKEILKNALSMVRPRILANEVELIVSHQDKTSSKAVVDSIEIQQVLVNLLANAIDSVSMLSDKTRTIRVVTGSSDGKFFSFQVIDNGPGISEEMSEKLFTAFESDKEMGSGIGLAISHMLAEQNGGTLELSHSNSDETAFECKLPLAAGTKQTP